MQMLQHVWTYKPLVHDVLSMQANSVTIDIKAEAGQLPGTTSKKRFEVGVVSHWQLLQCIACLEAQHHFQKQLCRCIMQHILPLGRMGGPFWVTHLSLGPC